MGPFSPHGGPIRQTPRPRLPINAHPLVRPNPEEPTYRHFERIVNLTLHAALFSALNSGLWVVQELRHPWAHLNWLTLGWLAVLLVHAGVVIAMRPAPPAENQRSKTEP